MKNKLLSILVIATTLLCISCSEEKDKNVTSLGIVECYDNFLWEEHTPDTIQMGRFVVEFADDAADPEYNASIMIGAVEIDEEGNKKPLATSDIQMYFNGKATSDNKFKISHGTEEVVLTAVVNPNAEDRIYKWNVEVLEEGKECEKLANEHGDRVEYFGESFEVEKDKITNPLKKNLTTTLIILFILILLWILVIRPLKYPGIRVNNILIIGPGNFYGSYNIKGAYKVILTSDANKKQKFMSRIFIGKIMYLYGDVWTQDIVFKNFNKNSITVITPETWSCSDFILEKYNTYELTNTQSPKDKGKITVN